MLSIKRFAVFESQWMTKTEVETFPETNPWRRLYRTERVNYVVWPLRDLYILGNSIYAHPQVIQKLKRILESTDDPRYFHEATELVHPVKVESLYTYNWAFAATTIMFLILMLTLLLS